MMRKQRSIGARRGWGVIGAFLVLAGGLSCGAADTPEEIESLASALNVCNETVPSEHYVDGIPAYGQCAGSENSSIYSSNGVDTSTTEGDGWVRTQWSGGYQCTELAHRYLYFVWGVDWIPRGDAGTWCDTQPPADSGLVQTQQPVHGDLIVFAPGDCGASATYGHVAVVDSVDNAGARVTFVEQNGANRRTSNQSCATCYLHVVDNDGSPGGAGGTSGAGGEPSTGGSSPSGGAPPTGGTPATGGFTGSGGWGPTGGTLSAGGTGSVGGTAPSGGAAPTGGTSPSGGAPSGGTGPLGGTSPAGGATASGAGPASSGGAAIATGGSNAGGTPPVASGGMGFGGSGGTGAAGLAPSTGAAGPVDPGADTSEDDDAGCACRVPAEPRGGSPVGVALIGAALAASAARRRRRAKPRPCGS